MSTLRALLFIGLTGAVFASSAASADEKVSDPSDRVREVVSHVRKVLDDLRDKLDQLGGVSEDQGGVSASVFGGVARPMPNFADFQRGAREVNDGAALVSSATAKCGDDARKVARRFSSDARRVQSAIDQLPERGDIGLMRARNAIEAAQSSLSDVAGISCGSAEDRADDN
jgi:hypothetical protein